MSDTPLAALLLSNQITRLAVAPLKAREFWALIDRTDALGLEVGELLAAPRVGRDQSEPNATSSSQAHPATDVLASVATDDVDVERLTALLAATRAFAFETERLAEAGVVAMSALDPRFPALLRDRLQHGCPPHLFAAGPADKLDRPSLAVIGRDTDSPATHSAARQAVAAAVVAAHSVVTGPPGSGLADTVVDEAVACEGDVVIVTADGINRSARDPALRRLVQQQRLCLVSPFVPDAAASPATTRARDTIVWALAHHTIVIAVDDGTGPAWATARAAVTCDPGSVFSFVGTGSEAGNHALVELGAQPIHHIDQLHEKLS